MGFAVSVRSKVRERPVKRNKHFLTCAGYLKYLGQWVAATRLFSNGKGYFFGIILKIKPILSRF